MFIRKSISASCLPLALIVVVGIISGSSGEDNVNNTDTKIEKINCVRIMMRAAKLTMKQLSSCSKEIKAMYPTNKEFGEKIACVLKCTMRRVTLINEDGRLTEESIMGLMRKYIPTEGMLQAARKKIHVPCLEPASKLDPSEENCKTYADYALCMQTAMEDFIDTSPYCLPRKRIPE